jgi:murein DD-endopeptidase MepM/ murein hydrolase activator NlpD
MAAIALVGTLATAGLIAIANAESSVQVALRQKRDLLQRIEELQETRRVRRIALHQQIRSTQARLREAPRAVQVGDRERFRDFRKDHLQRVAYLRRQERRLVKAIRSRVVALRNQRTQLATWIDSLPLQRCPVAGAVTPVDNFGVIREMPGTPRHVHQGNDIAAPVGTPIVAPFDGTASASQSELGGLQVKVYGVAGYVYNAHLSAYGRLGAVRAGDVIGYVGMTGNATAPHNHFEWHPGDGGAVDPFMYLVAVC